MFLKKHGHKNACICLIISSEAMFLFYFLQNMIIKMSPYHPNTDHNAKFHRQLSITRGGVK